MKSTIDEVTKLHDNHIIVLVILLALIGPGLATLLVFFPSAITSLDVFKLLLISSCFGLSLSLPLAIVLLLRYGKIIAGDDGRLAVCLTISSIITLITVALTVTVAYLFKWDFMTYLYTILAITIVAWPLVLGLLPTLRKRGLV
ncbi:MAG: hypothetical protein WBP22_06245 [Candidatus Saccharimonas sp.]